MKRLKVGKEGRISILKKTIKTSSKEGLLKRGNVGLARLLIAIHNAGPKGITTYKLLEQLGSTNHAQVFIELKRRA